MSATKRPDWYDPDVYPEWRPSAPWVMEDMIAAEPQVTASTAAAVDAEAAELAGWLRDSVALGEPIVSSAVGTAGHAARGVAVALNEALGNATAGRVEFRESDDQARAPREGGVCIAVSHGGMSTSTVNSLSSAKAAGARTVLITASSGSPAHDLADLVLTLPVKDKSYCHTVGYTAPIVAGLVAGAHYRNETFAAAEVESYLAGLSSLATDAAPIGQAMAGVQRFIAAGSLVDEPSARELALDIAEGAWVPASVFGLEDVLHGHLVGHDGASALTAVLTGGPSAGAAAGTAERVLRAAGRIGLRTAAIVTDRLADRIDDAATNAGRLVLPTGAVPDIVVTLLGGALALQYLTMSLVYVKGVNPDLLRRDQDPYREAVVVGGAKLPRR